MVQGYAAGSLTFVLLKRAFNTASMKGWIISDDPERSVDSASLRRTARFNSLVSVGFMSTCCYAFANFLVHERAFSLLSMVFDIVLVIILYDFGYYFIHRYPFHEWKMLRRVHSIHHKTRHPRAIDSLLLHPAETCIGLGAFLAAVALAGSVHYYTFGVLFVGYMLTIAQKWRFLSISPNAEASGPSGYGFFSS